MADTVVPVTSSVNGDITDCKIETAQIKVDRKGAFSLTQKETYRTYDVCTKKTVNEYTTSTITGGGLGLILLGTVFVVFVIAIIANIVSDY